VVVQVLDRVAETEQRLLQADVLHQVQRVRIVLVPLEPAAETPRQAGREARYLPWLGAK
jgi:hypothetical protein